LNGAWRHLDTEQKALLALHDIEGHSLAELQEITGLKQGTLKSRLHRARVRLGKLLRREDNAHEVIVRSGAGR
jgi:DNA-directed RNA polymerase specialized sigma24 family protein